MIPFNKRLGAALLLLATTITQACRTGSPPAQRSRNANTATNANVSGGETSASSECDPNYSGCVPIASDVDCAGGSGNGPAYVKVQ